MTPRIRSKTRFTTRLARATRAVAATLAIVGVAAVLASVQTARAFDQQASTAASDDMVNRQAAGVGDAVAPPPGPYASARRARRSATPPAARKDFQDGH